MGYIEETGAAQTFRDARITSIYEGTTGIQSNDLIGRKIGRDRGAALLAFLDEMQTSLAALTPIHASAHAGPRARRTMPSRDCARPPTSMLAALATAPDRAMAVSVPFLRLCGLTIGGWLMARAADIAANELAAGASDREFLAGKTGQRAFLCDAGAAAGAHARAHRARTAARRWSGTDAALI